MEFSRPKYWRPFSSPGDLPIQGIKPRSPTLQADSLPGEPQGKPNNSGRSTIYSWNPGFSEKTLSWIVTKSPLPPAPFPQININLASDNKPNQRTKRGWLQLVH